MKTQTTLNRIGAALLIAALAGTTVAADPNIDESDVLRGPEVTQSSSAESNDTMTGKADRAKGERQNAQRATDLPMTAFVNAVRGLNKAGKDNPELALTEDQLSQIKEIAEGYKAKMEAYLDEHSEELGPMYADRESRPEPRNARNERSRAQQNKQGKEDRADAPERPEQPSMSKQEMKELRAKRAEIMKNAPSAAEEKKQIFALLTSDQRAAVKEHLSKIQETRARRASMAMGRGGNSERAQGRAEGRGERGESKNKERAPRRESKEDD